MTGAQQTQKGGEVFVLSSAPLTGTGGVERLFRYIIQGLLDRGYRVRVFDSENSGPQSWCRPDRSNNLAWIFASLLQGYFVGREAKRALHSGLCFILSTSTVGWYPLGNSISKAHFYHGTYWGVAEAIRPWIRWRGYLKLKWWDAMLLERLSGRAKIRLCNSEQTREEIERVFGYQSRTVWLPLDTKVFCPRNKADCRARTHLAPSAKVGLFAGSLQPHKGYPIVRALIESCPGIDWVLIIRGPAPNSSDLPARVRVVQGLPDEQLVDFYNAADFLISPSLYEPFGYVVAEALACGTAAIAFPCGASFLLMREPPLNALVIQPPFGIEKVKAAVARVVENTEFFRETVIRQVRPMIEETLAPESWWPRFLEVTGL
jgi:glycosyltransferase involved in cell wall biosynthesis